MEWWTVLRIVIDSLIPILAAVHLVRSYLSSDEVTGAERTRRRRYALGIFVLGATMLVTELQETLDWSGYRAALVVIENLALVAGVWMLWPTFRRTQGKPDPGAARDG